MVRRALAVCGMVAGGGLLGSACLAETGSPEPEGSRASPDPEEDAEVLALIMGEPIGEAAASVTVAGDACRAGCAASYAAACYRVTALCGAAEVITIGGATVPCATAIPAVCLTGAALAAVCGGRCPP
jgi:hypothetical protein